MFVKKLSCISLYVLMVFAVISLVCSDNLVVNAAQAETASIVGRWDVTVHAAEGDYSSWFEIKASGGDLSGSFVGRFGSARPIVSLNFDSATITFSLPPQFEGQKEDLRFVGRLANGKISGETKTEKGVPVKFSAERAPSLASTCTPEWGETIDLLAKDSLAQWNPLHPDGPFGWSLENGVLTNNPPSVDILTKSVFDDFKVHLEFNVGKDSNSGVYLRGRYEMQIHDSYGMEPESHLCGGIYGFIDPSNIAVKAPGEWNDCDITFIGRNVTIVMNGLTIIDNKEIPGITGGAINSREGEPGPLMIQGDHGFIQYRNIKLTPAK